MSNGSPAWGDYVFARTTKESAALWRDACSEPGTTLLICGAGFDPRSLDVPTEYVGQVGAVSQVLALEIPMVGLHLDADRTAVTNKERLEALFGAKLSLVRPPTATDPSSQATVLTRSLVADHGLLTFETVILDMSGLPSLVSFSILQLLLSQAAVAPTEPDRFGGNLLVSVSEDPSTDARIVAVGLQNAEEMTGFADLSSEDGTRIWVPVLGRDAVNELQALRTHLEPDEICAVLPFPAQDARTGDDLLLAHRNVLIDEFDIEPRNVFYAAESNPFDLYRQLLRLAERYRAALQPLGRTSVIVSEHTSKLLSLGVLLAAHEGELTVAHVRPSGYQLDAASSAKRNPTIFTAWLTGAPYGA